MPKYHLVKGWEIHVVIDSDDHITITAKHESGTKVSDVGEDFLDRDGEFTIRLTCEAIEEKFQRTGQ